MSMLLYLIRVDERTLHSCLEDSSHLEAMLDREELLDRMIDIDKAWDGILFLLTGSSIAGCTEHPMSRIFFSGQAVDERQDFGYGPAHYLRPQQVAELQAMLAAIEPAALQARFSPALMTEEEVYPGWDSDDEADGLIEAFRDVQGFYAAAAARDEAIISLLV